MAAEHVSGRKREWLLSQLRPLTSEPGHGTTVTIRPPVEQTPRIAA